MDNIGFYTLSNKRCRNLSVDSPMWRCELILTDRCNFKCPYCRGLKTKGDMPYEQAVGTLVHWIADGLKNVRFSGGEPTVYPGLIGLVKICANYGVENIAISTNGSAPTQQYMELIDAGVNDFSISLDACCAADGGEMAGTSGAVWQRVVDNIKALSARTYVTVGVVITGKNVNRLNEIVEFAHSLGVSDIRIISAAQYGELLTEAVKIPQHILDAHPILKYRVENIKKGRDVRGIGEYDSPKCFLPIDDSVVCGDKHYPCVIYMREQGKPIGTVGPDMRTERILWALDHKPHKDPICSKNCLDVCIDHNNQCLLEVYKYGRETNV